MQSESYVFDPRPEFPYLITAKRYWGPQFCSTDVDALTFICTHGVGLSKEHWEPTLEELYKIIGNRSGHRYVKIREAWSIDAPNHGDAAILNESILSSDSKHSFPLEDYARAVHLVLSSLGTGIKIDFWSRKLVGVGHSMGTVAIILAASFPPIIKFHSIILVEPILSPVSASGDSVHQFGIKLANMLSAHALRSKESWSNCAELLKYLTTKSPMSSWDPRAQRIFVNNNTRVRLNTNYLTLKCSRAQEATIYHDHRSRYAASAYLRHLSSTTPVYFIYGERADLIPIQYQERLVRETTSGKYAARRVEGAGHAIPQTHPGGLAVEIVASLGMNVCQADDDLRARL